MLKPRTQCQKLPLIFGTHGLILGILYHLFSLSMSMQMTDCISNLAEFTKVYHPYGKIRFPLCFAVCSKKFVKNCRFLVQIPLRQFLHNCRRTHLLLKSDAWASCLELTMSLVYDLLKFQMAILQIHCYFLLKKM